MYHFQLRSRGASHEGPSLCLLFCHVVRLLYVFPPSQESSRFAIFHSDFASRQLFGVQSIKDDAFILGCYVHQSSDQFIKFAASCQLRGHGATVPRGRRLRCWLAGEEGETSQQRQCIEDSEKQRSPQSA